VNRVKILVPTEFILVNPGQNWTEVTSIKIWMRQF